MEKVKAEPVNRDGPEFDGVMVLRQPYTYDTNLVSDESGLDCGNLPSRTQQHFAEEVDINTIVRRFGLTGELPSNVPMVLQGDFTNVLDFRTAMDMVVQARESFDAQPASVRNRFDNDPQKFLAFVSDKANIDEAIKLGLIREESVQARAQELAAARAAEIGRAVEVELAAREKAAKAAPGPVST